MEGSAREFALEQKVAELEVRQSRLERAAATSAANLAAVNATNPATAGNASQGTSRQ